MKLVTTLENLMADPTLEVRELNNRKGKDRDVIPFSAEILPKSIKVKVPTFARVSVQESWRWADIHNGQQWGANGVSSPQTELELSFPIETSLRISAEGRTWLVRLRPVHHAKHRPSLGATLKSSRYLGFSLFGHLNLLLLLWLAVSHNLDFGSSASRDAEKALKEVKKQEQAAASSEGGGMPESRPFEGMSYTEYLRRIEAAKREANPLGYLAQSLNNMKVKDNGLGKGKGAAIKSATGAIGSGMGGGTGTSLSDTVSNQKFTLQAPTSAGGKNITEKQKLALREKFRELQDDFKRIYSKLLSQDPNLSVTVTFQTKVLPNGYLELAEFKARGNYQAATLPLLKSAMADVIRSVFVGPELSGLTLRAENVFVR